MSTNATAHKTIRKNVAELWLLLQQREIGSEMFESFKRLAEKSGKKPSQRLAKAMQCVRQIKRNMEGHFY